MAISVSHATMLGGCSHDKNRIACHGHSDLDMSYTPNCTQCVYMTNSLSFRVQITFPEYNTAQRIDTEMREYYG